ncbi:MAG: Mu-like prophage major head subunit gpT family protein [Planktomarina sp.]
MIVTDASLAALMTGFKKSFGDQFAAFKAKAEYEKIATVIPSSTRSNTYGWLGDFPEMREWIGDRVIKDMETHSYSITNKTFETTVGVKKTDIEDDNLGVYTHRFGAMAQRAAQQPDKLVFNLLKKGHETLCFDGQNFFDADHPAFDSTGQAVTVSNVDSSGGTAPYWYVMDTNQVLKPMIFQQRKAPEFVSKEDPKNSDHVFMKNEYLFGVEARCNVGFGFWQMAYASNAPLNGDNLSKAMVAMQSHYDTAGEPIYIEPSLLVVPPTLQAAANKTVKAMLIDGGNSNPHYDTVDVLSTSWLN